MHIIFSNAAGLRVEAVLLAAGRGRLRVTASEFDDAVELRFSEGQWRIEDGDAVEIDSMISDGGTEAAQMCAEFFPRTLTARN